MAISVVVLKVASRCNLNCSYCYMYQHEDQSYLRQPKFISDEVFDGTLRAMKEYCDRRGEGMSMALCFHGGEPTLIGARRFDELATRARRFLGTRLRMLAIQTNALLLDDNWLEAFQRHDVHVSVSLDGTEEIHDRFRVDHQGNGSHARTVAGIRMLQEKITPKVISVVNPGRSGGDAYRFLRSLGITSMDFLLPDVTHDSKESFYGGLGATPVADFLIPAFDAWFDEDDPDIQVRLFRDALMAMMGDAPGSDALGNPLMGYLIVETDGAIQALDALRVCQEGIADSDLNVLQHSFDDLQMGKPLVYRAVHQGFGLAAECEVCPEREVCGGGHLPHRYSRARGFDNPSAWCADILKFLDHVRQRSGVVPIAAAS